VKVTGDRHRSSTELGTTSRLVLGGSHSGQPGRQRVTSGIRLGATLALQRLRCWSDPSPRHHLQASQVGCGLRLRAPVSYQLGRSVLVSLARPAGTYALVTHVRRSVVNRECPPIIVASGPAVVRARTRGLFVPKPSREADCQGCGQSDLGTTVRQRPPASAGERTDRYSVGYSPAREPYPIMFPQLLAPPAYAPTRVLSARLCREGDVFRRLSREQAARPLLCSRTGTIRLRAACQSA
jgi:hypothetical protein